MSSPSPANLPANFHVSSPPPACRELDCTAANGPEIGWEIGWGGRVRQPISSQFARHALRGSKISPGNELAGNWLVSSPPLANSQANFQPEIYAQYNTVILGLRRQSSCSVGLLRGACRPHGPLPKYRCICQSGVPAARTAHRRICQPHQFAIAAVAAARMDRSSNFTHGRFRSIAAELVESKGRDAVVMARSLDWQHRHMAVRLIGSRRLWLYVLRHLGPDELLCSIMSVRRAPPLIPLPDRPTPKSKQTLITDFWVRRVRPCRGRGDGGI